MTSTMSDIIKSRVIIPSQSGKPFLKDPLFADWWYQIRRPIRMIRPTTVVGNGNYSETPKESEEKQEYKIMVNMTHFKPEEVQIHVDKTTEGGKLLVIHGKHKSNDGHTDVAREVARKYTFPSYADIKSLHCNLSSDGVLQIVAPCKLPPHKAKSLPPTVGKPSCWASVKRTVKKWLYKLAEIQLDPFCEQSRPHKLRNHSNDKDYFKGVVHVKYFEPDELKVTCDYAVLTVEEKCEVPFKSDGPYSKEFVKRFIKRTRFTVPEGVKAEELNWNLKTPRVVEIVAPKQPTLVKKGEGVVRILPIELEY